MLYDIVHFGVSWLLCKEIVKSADPAGDMLWFVCPCLSGVAANCASALAQMAAASCVQEEKEERETAESGDAITQGVRSHTHTHIQNCLPLPLNMCFFLSSEAASGADVSSFWCPSSHSSCLVYGRHPKCRTGDGQPQPGLLDSCVQVHEHTHAHTWCMMWCSI